MIQGFTPLPTISSQVLTILKRNKKWVSRGTLEDLVRGHNGDSVSRILRYMAGAKEIKKDYRKVVPSLRPLVFYRI